MQEGREPSGGRKWTWAAVIDVYWIFAALAGVALPGVAAGANNASIVEGSSAVPGGGSGGATVAVVVRVLNTGSTTWRAADGYRLGAASANEIGWSGWACSGYMNHERDGRAFLCHDTAPGQTHDFRFNVHLPASGTTRFSVRMVRDGVEWFGETQTWDISVGGGGGCPLTPIATPSDRWKLEMFDNPQLSGSPVEVRTEAPGSAGFSFNWGGGRASSCTGNDHYGIRFSRRIQIATSGEYTFTTTTDDGVRLWVDGQLVVDRWIDQAPTAHSGTIFLATGTHDVRMDYYERGGGAVAAINWERTGGGCSSSPIATPTDRWKLEIFDNRDLSGSPVDVRTDAAGSGGFHFDWGGRRASDCTGNDDFSIRFSRRIQITTSGEYTFTTTTDDGVRLWIGGAPIIDRWVDQAPTSVSGKVFLAAGAHDVRMDYYERGGGAVAAVGWERTGGGCSSSPIGVPNDRWRLEIYNNPSLGGTPAEVRTDAPGPGGFAFDWGGGRASACTANDRFSIRFGRKIRLAEGGDYTFTTTTDDGVQLWVDGQLVIDRWIDQAPTVHSGRITLTPGAHELTMNYYENGGGAVAAIRWEKTGGGGGGGGGSSKLGPHFLATAWGRAPIDCSSLALRSPSSCSGKGTIDSMSSRPRAPVRKPCCVSSYRTRSATR